MRAESSPIVSLFEVFSGVFHFAGLILILDFQYHKDTHEPKEVFSKI